MRHGLELWQRLLYHPASAFQGVTRVLVWPAASRATTEKVGARSRRRSGGWCASTRFGAGKRVETWPGVEGAATTRGPADGKVDLLRGAVSVSQGWLDVWEPGAHLAGARPRLLPRVHRADTWRAQPRCAPHRLWRASRDEARRVFLYGRPLCKLQSHR